MQQYEHNSLTTENLLQTSFSEPLYRPCSQNSLHSILTPRNVLKSSQRCNSGQINHPNLRITGSNTIQTILCIQHNDQDIKSCNYTVNKSKFGDECVECVQQLDNKTAMLVPPSTSKAFVKGYRGKCVGFGKILNFIGEGTNKNNCLEQFQTDMIDPLLENFLKKSGNSHHDVLFMHGCNHKLFNEVVRQFLRSTLDKFLGAKIKCRAFEIIDDKIIDILLQGNLQVRSNKYQIKNVGNMVQIQGVVEFEVQNEDKIEELVIKIANMRQRLMHAYRENGHSICDIVIEENNENQPKQFQKTNFCISLVSLGVIDKLNETQSSQVQNKSRKISNKNSNISTNSIQQLKIQRNNLYVNTSLSTLSRCIQNLQQSQKNPQNNQSKVIIPYRESKLTHIFRDVLHGHGKIYLIAIISDKNSDFDQSLNSVRFVQQATTLKPVIKQLNYSKSGNYYNNNNIISENSFISSNALISRDSHMRALSPTNSSCTGRSVFFCDRSQILELEEKNNQLLKVIQQLTQEGDSELLAMQLAITHQQLQQIKKENGILRHELLNVRQHMSLQQEALEDYRQNISGISEQKIAGHNQNQMFVENFQQLLMEKNDFEDEQGTDEFSVFDVGDENDSLMGNLNVQGFIR